MARLRFKGFQTSAPVTIAATAGGQSDSASATAFQRPSPVSGFPRISGGQFQTDTLTGDETGLTNVTARSWQVVGGATLGTASTQSLSGVSGHVTYTTTSDEGTLTSPPVFVYMSMSMTSHDTDDMAMLALASHTEATHIAILTGNWTDAATWLDGNIPTNGACVLIPHGIDVTYDFNEPNVRLDWMRVDGTLSLTTAENVHRQMLVENLLISRSGAFVIGTGHGDRLPANSSFTCTISGKDYSANSFTPTYMKANSFSQTRGWSRGVLVQGKINLYGAEKTTWGFANAQVPIGATSLTAENDLVNVVAGDTIIIGATTDAYVDRGLMGVQDEYREVDSVVGNTINWVTPLVYPHDNQVAASTRTDKHPAFGVIRGKNIVFQSEVADDVNRRGHFAAMHHHAECKLVGVGFYDLGRTDKAGMSGVIHTDGTFRYLNSETKWHARVLDYIDASFRTELEAAGYILAPSSGTVTSITLPSPNPNNEPPLTVDGSGNLSSVTDQLETRPLDPFSDLQGRYSIHMHTMGAANMAVVQECCVDGSPGHGIVQHDTGCILQYNIVHGFYGAGFVAETGNETGPWTGNAAFHTTFDSSRRDISLLSNAKTLETPEGLAGDAGRMGAGFYNRSRAIKSADNLSVSCGVGYQYNHRLTPGVALSNAVLIKNLDKDLLDIGQLQVMIGASYPTQLPAVDHPILGFDNNHAIACVKGLAITKPGPGQKSDVGSHFMHFNTFGCLQPIEDEYVSNYSVDMLDALGCAPASNGTYDAGYGALFSGNAYQMAAVNCRMEGFSDAVGNLLTSDTANAIGNADNTDNPIWVTHGLDAVNCGNDIDGYVPSRTHADVSVRNDDFDGSAFDRSADPYTTLPLVLGTSDGISAFAANPPSNADGRKVDNFSNNALTVPKFFGDQPFPQADAIISAYLATHGYYQYGGTDVAVFVHPMTDWMTGRLGIETHMIELTGSITNTRTDHGAFTYTPAPVTASDIAVEVTAGGSVSVDVVSLSGAAGGGGAGSYKLHTGFRIDPFRGLATYDAYAGTLAYTPYRQSKGTDFLQIPIVSDGQFKTVIVNFLIGGNAASLDTPVVDTHFTATDHANANTIGVQLLAPPDAGGRRITLTQYSTDAGTTWRRLCHGWVQAVHKATVESDGTAIANGAYNLRLRYKTDFDFSTSSASGDDAVTVS